MAWIPLVVMLALIAPLAALTDRGRKATELRVRRLEWRLDQVMSHLGLQEPEPDAPPGVIQELAAGRKIEAIKLYRQATGVGLREAKDAVESLARRHFGA